MGSKKDSAMERPVTPKENKIIVYNITVHNYAPPIPTIVEPMTPKKSSGFFKWLGNAFIAIIKIIPDLISKFSGN